VDIAARPAHLMTEGQPAAASGADINGAHRALFGVGRRWRANTERAAVTRPRKRLGVTMAVCYRDPHCKSYGWGDYLMSSGVCRCACR